MFGIDFDTLARHLTPPVIAKGSHLEWLRALLSPLTTLNGIFTDYRAELIKRLRYNGQVIILENLLNDLFDDTDRLIYIDTVNDRLSGVYVYQPSEDVAEFISQPGEAPPVYIFQANEPMNVGYDFIVWVPDGILDSEQQQRIKAVVYKYKLAGKIAQFRFFNGTIF
jgi:hypothetical protein